MNRSDLIDACGFSLPQASTDLNRYLAIPPDRMVYDKSARAYIYGSDLSPHFMRPDAGHHLFRFLSLADGILNASETRNGQFSAFDATPAPAVAINTKILRSVAASIGRSESIENRYPTLSRLDSKWRWIPPHATGFDGFRWHARAFYYIDSMYRDFLLSQIPEPRCTELGKADLRADASRQEFVALETGPRPVLPDTRKKAVSLDYGTRNGKAKIKARRTFPYYTVKRPDLDTAPVTRRLQDPLILPLTASKTGTRRSGSSYAQTWLSKLQYLTE